MVLKKRFKWRKSKPGMGEIIMMHEEGFEERFADMGGGKDDWFFSESGDLPPPLWHFCVHFRDCRQTI